MELSRRGQRLTPPMQQLYAFLVYHRHRVGRTPTAEEACEQLAITRPEYEHRIKALKGRGLVKRTRAGWVLVEKARSRFGTNHPHF